MTDQRNLTFILKGIPLNATDLLDPTKKLQLAHIELRVKAKQITGTNKNGLVDNIRLSLKKLGDTTIDVLYDDLLKPENLNKSFTITRADLDKATFTSPNRLLLSREAYYNVAPIKKTLGLTSKQSNWKKPQISDDLTLLEGKTAKDIEWNAEIRKYNYEIKNNYVIKCFDVLDDEFNSQGPFRELKSIWEGKIAAAGLRNREGNTITTLVEVGTTAGDKDVRIKFLKDFTEHFESDLLKKERIIKEAEQEIENWKSNGGMVDDEYNQEIENYDTNDPIIKSYNELCDKVDKVENYKRFKPQFDKESKEETEPRVSADKDLTLDIYLPKKVEDSDDADGAKAKKEKYQERKKILARKKAVIDLIEGLVSSDGGGNKVNCPQCNKQFTTLPISHNGVNYCSDNCKNEANKGGGGDKYTCTKCKKEFSGSPVVKDGKKYCSQCSTEEGPNKDKGNISQTKTAAIQAINDALKGSPQITTNDLDANFRNWEAQINGFSKVEEINSFKGQVLSNIAKKRNEKKSAEEIKEVLKGIENKTGSELRDTIKKAEKFDGKKGYEAEKGRVSQAIDRSWQEDNAELKKVIKEVVENKMTACGIKEEELGSEEKNILTKIKNKEHNDKDQLKTDKNKLLAFIGNKEVDKRIKSYEKEIEAALKSKDQAKKKTIGSKLLAMLGEDNIYVDKRRADIDNLFKKITETSSGSPTDSPKSDIPWKIIIPIALIAVLILAIAVVMVRRKKQTERDIE